MGKSSGRSTTVGRQYTFQGLKLQDKLQLSLMRQDMHHPRKEE